MSKRAGKWANKRANEPTSGQMSKRAGKWANEWANEQTSGQMSKRAGKWANEQANEQMSRQMSKCAGKWGQDHNSKTRVVTLKLESCFWSKVFYHICHHHYHPDPHYISFLSVSCFLWYIADVIWSKFHQYWPRTFFTSSGYQCNIRLS